MSEREAIQRALQEAEKSLGKTLPNPPVGCVILDKNHRFLSSGFYAHYGALHAEVSALNKIKDKRALQAAHLFVTLEPCAHFGQNPPCVDQLLKYPFASVVYGAEDPNPKTKRGCGLKKLQSKEGLKVSKTKYFQNHLRRLYEAFDLNMRRSKTFFAMKVASSLDGITCLSHGESQWISDKSSKPFTFNLRAGFSAVLIGLQCFLEDNPRLNCRGQQPESETISNKVCLLDPLGQSFDLIEKSRLAQVRDLRDIFVLSHREERRSRPFKILRPALLTNSKNFDLKQLKTQLYGEGISSVLIEGGAHTFSSFLQQGAVERLYCIINPSLLGAGQGRGWTEGLSVSSLKDKKLLESLELISFKKDLILTARIPT